jgi:hypothetical protein
MFRIIGRLSLVFFVFAITFGIAHGLEQEKKIGLKIEVYKGFNEAYCKEDKVVWVLWSIPQKNESMQKETKIGLDLNPKMVDIQNENKTIVIRKLAECSWIFGQLDPGFEQHFVIYIKDDVEYYIKLTEKAGKIKLAVSPVVYSFKSDSNKVVFSHLMQTKLVIEEFELNRVAGFLNGDNEMIYMTFSLNKAPFNSNDLYNADFSLMSYERLDYPKYLKSKLLDAEVVHGEIGYGLFDNVEFVKVQGRYKKFLETLEKKIKSMNISRFIGFPKKYYLKTRILFIKGEPKCGRTLSLSRGV